MLRLPLMPSGFEHKIAADCGRMDGELRLPLMPSGFEHMYQRSSSHAFST